MNARRALSILSLSVLILNIGAARAQKPSAPTDKPAAAAPAPPPAATVGTRVITRAELDARVQQMLEEYRARKGAALPAEMRDLVRRQVLEGLIRAQLMTLEARRQGALAGVGEAEAALKQMPLFNPEGKFDPSRFAAVKASQPVQFAQALQGMREQLGARKLAAGLEDRFAPPEAEARATAARELSRATVDQLALVTRDFAGTFAEPRESQVAEYYRNHVKEFMREDRAILRIAFVNSPELSDSLKAIPARSEAWSHTMRARAESLIAVVHQGVSFDSAAAPMGFRSNIVVARDNFPGYWRGTDAQRNLVFRPESRGRVLPEPIATTEGWLVVLVDDVTPAHAEPFQDVSREIRSRIRADLRVHHEEYERHALYDRLRDSLVAPGWIIRYAAVDTSTFEIREPGEPDLDRYYRGHQADYATLDPKSGAIVTRALSEVRSEVRMRYLHDERQLQSRQLAEQLLQHWRDGRKDAALEARLGVRTTPPVVLGCRVDTGLVAQALSDTIWKKPAPRGGALFAWSRGWIVWDAMTRLDRVTPTYFQAQDMIATGLRARQEAAELDGARALYLADPGSFRKADVIHFTRLHFQPVKTLLVPLSRAEVEKWYHDHIEHYSAPEMMGARHILVQPANASAAADQAARAKAQDILRRLQAGEDFTKLARAYSDDPGTRDIGGDLGTFARGTMLEPFEKVVFGMEPGTLHPEVVKTELGYHVIKATEHLPLVVRPLHLIYAGVSGDAAEEKANQMAAHVADSLYRGVKEPRRLVAAAPDAGGEVEPLTYGLDEPMNNPDAVPFFKALLSTKAGHIVPGAFPVRGQGAWLAIVDSIVPATSPTWEQAQPAAMERFRRGAGERVLAHKRAELDSLLAGGMSLDSLAAYWGGLTRLSDLAPGHGLPYVGKSVEVDSLLFGGARGGPSMATGATSSWITLPGGITRLRLVSRSAAGAAAVSERATLARRTALEQRLGGYFDDLRRRYPVRILDPTLRDLPMMVPEQPSTAP